jgi:hypothetical protein
MAPMNDGVPSTADVASVKVDVSARVRALWRSGRT